MNRELVFSSEVSVFITSFYLLPRLKYIGLKILVLVKKDVQFKELYDL